ncbi:hypothetical protein ABPG74_015476 [Tetrahymena malaccensis]
MKRSDIKLEESQKNYFINLKDSNLDSKDYSETYSAFSESMQMQVEVYEMSGLVEKFDNIQKNNISKNIIKAFFSYLLDTNDNDLLTDFVMKDINLSQARKMTKNYIKAYNFNNNSLLKLMQHSKYGKAFEFYLTFDAERWLSESKVQLKEIDLIYIDFLKLCCSNPKYQNHLITYKKNKKNLTSITASQIVFMRIQQQQKNKKDRNIVFETFFNPESNLSIDLSEEDAESLIKTDQEFSQKQEKKMIFDTNSMPIFSSQFNDEENKQNQLLLQKFDQICKNNIGKNITKGFFSFLLDKNNDLLTDFVLKDTPINYARRLVKNFIQSYNFNNNYLHKLIQHEKFEQLQMNIRDSKTRHPAQTKSKQEPVTYI